MIRQCVLDAFPVYTEQFESYTDYPYLDIEGLRTIGFGCLVNDLGPFQRLHFTRPDLGRDATQAEIIAAWRALGTPEAQATCKSGGGHYAAMTQIRATQECLDALMASKLKGNVALFKPTFPGWEDFSADAQLGILSKDWAIGPYGFKDWPHFVAACNAGQWDEAAVQCVPSPAQMAKQNESYHRRIAAEVVLFKNAARSVEPDTLFYPGVLEGP